MVIAYRNNSTGSDKINVNNWFNIVNQNNAKLGIGNPNMGPGGYRATMMIQLVNKYYADDSIFNNLIASHSTITSKENGTGHTIYSPMNAKNDSKYLWIE
jgi:molybdate/tungstate transport system substrate-binding protein